MVVFHHIRNMNIFGCIILLCCFATAFSRIHGDSRDHHLKNKGHTSFKLKYQSGECRSNKLKCVPTDDCELECPHGFVKLKEGGACYFVSSEEFNPNRTINEAEDYCETINSRLLWIEDADELEEIVFFIENLLELAGNGTSNETMENGTEVGQLSYFLAAEFDKSKGSWIWKGTHDEIDWDILLYNIPNASVTLQAIQDININKCLVLKLPQDQSNPESIITESECISKNNYICKLGQARARCSKSSSTKCCYSPSYDFYVQNREHGFANLNLRPGTCQFKIDGELMKCSEVLLEIKGRIDEVNKYAVARIGSSYYYIANSSDVCLGREAIISDEDVHSHITSLLATKENFYNDKNIKIGLTFKLENQMAYWVNGKPQEYYDQFWFPGEPRRDESVDGGCAAYTNVPGTATYLWKLFSEDVCENFDKVCELPLIKTSNIAKEDTAKKCGKRKERGVLAKSVYSIYSTDEANFGEFPWQAAVMYPEKYGREVKRKFACSGALIHESFVLTSAHCVTSVNVQKDFVVVLGQHDLKDETHVLEPVVMDVKEVILHHDFDVRQSSLDDIALLQLDGEVDVDAYPHIGLGCLPDPDEIRYHGGEWECLVTGWDSNKYGSRSKILKKLEADFTSEEYCKYLNKEYYKDLEYNRYKGYSEYKHNYYYRSEDPELLCTTTSHAGCLEDQSPILICKKETSFVHKPFYGKRESYGYQTNPKQYEHKSDNLKYEQKNKNLKNIGYKKYSDDDYETIVNAYGEDRFDNEKWYIIGIGNTLSECRDLDYYYNYGIKYHSRPHRFRPYYRSAQFDKQFDKYEGINSGTNYDKGKKYERRAGEKHEYGRPKSYKNYPDEYHISEENYSREKYGKPYAGLNYKSRYDMTEVFTSVYDYINFIYYILDLHQ